MSIEQYFIIGELAARRELKVLWLLKEHGTISMARILELVYPQGHDDWNRSFYLTALNDLHARGLIDNGGGTWSYSLTKRGEVFIDIWEQKGWEA